MTIPYFLVVPQNMIPLHRDPHFTFRFADDRIIPRFHLEDIGSGQHVSVFKFNPVTNERLGLITTAIVGEGGWTDLPEPIIVRAGEGFVVILEEVTSTSTCHPA